MMKAALEEFDRQQKSVSASSTGTTVFIPVSSTISSTSLPPQPPGHTKQPPPSSSMADHDFIRMRYLRSLNISIDRRKSMPDPVGGVAASAPIPIPIGSLAQRLEMESSDDDSRDSYNSEEDSPLDVSEVVDRRRRRMARKRANTEKKAAKDFVPPHQMVVPSTFTVKHSLPIQYQDHRKKNIGL